MQSEDRKVDPIHLLLALLRRITRSRGQERARNTCPYSPDRHATPCWPSQVSHHFMFHCIILYHIILYHRVRSSHIIWCFIISYHIMQCSRLTIELCTACDSSLCYPAQPRPILIRILETYSAAPVDTIRCAATQLTAAIIEVAEL